MVTVLFFVAIWEKHICAKHGSLKRRRPVAINDRVTVAVHGVDVTDFRSGRMSNRIVVVRSGQRRVNSILGIKNILVLNICAFFLKRQHVIRLLGNSRNVDFLGIVGKCNQLLCCTIAILHARCLALNKRHI